jgi:hypothetical protein
MQPRIAFGRSTSFEVNVKKYQRSKTTTSELFWQRALASGTDVTSFEATKHRQWADGQPKDLDTCWLDWKARNSQLVNESLQFRSALATSIRDSSGHAFQREPTRVSEEYNLGDWTLACGQNGVAVVSKSDSSVIPSDTRLDDEGLVNKLVAPPQKDEQVMALLMFEDYFRHMENEGKGRLEAASANRIKIQANLQQKWDFVEEIKGGCEHVSEKEAIVSVERRLSQTIQP